jgi:hypothetical protein
MQRDCRCGAPSQLAHQEKTAALQQHALIVDDERIGRAVAVRSKPRQRRSAGSSINKELPGIALSDIDANAGSWEKELID